MLQPIMVFLHNPTQAFHALPALTRRLMGLRAAGSWALPAALAIGAGSASAVIALLSSSEAGRSAALAGLTLATSAAIGRAAWVMSGRRAKTAACERLRQEFAEERRRLRFALTDAQMGLWEWDLTADHITLDAACRELLELPEREHYAAAELPGLHVAESVETLSRAVEEGDQPGAAVYTHESIRDLGAGDMRHILTRAHILRVGADGRPSRMVGTHRDVTAQRAAEQGIMQAREAAEAASRSKSEFLANMSHEIRTPLNAVAGMADLLAHTPLTARQQRYVGIVHSSATSLASLINDILDFSKIEAGRLELENIDLNVRDIIEDTVEMFTHRCDQKGIELICSVHASLGSMLKGDPTRLRQILVNLINNAVKFTEKGSIVVRAEVRERSPEHLTLKCSVTDSGIGIHSDRLSRLFKSFSQVDASTTRRFGGTGLGLAISRELVSAMGGEIGVESSPGKGSAFWFTLSLPCGATGKQTNVPTMLRGGRVVIVDDQEVNRDILAHLVNHWGMSPEVFESGELALAALADSVTSDGAPLIALLDMKMPGMDGVALAVRIRQLPECRDLPLLILSSSDESDGGSARAADVATVLPKPIRHSRLFDAIVTAVSGGPSIGHVTSPLPCAVACTRSLRVLVAEDNDVNQMVVSEILQRLGHACRLVSSGAEVVEAALHEPDAFDAMLMDCQMPDVDGFEATRRIRENEQGSGRRVPIVALTANAVKGDRERCLQAGMDGYLPKPLDPKELNRVLDAIAEGLPATAAGIPDVVGGTADLLHGERLLSRCMGNLNLSKTLISKCLDQARVIAAGIRDAQLRHDHPSLVSGGHALKGSAANAGLASVSRIAADIEQLSSDATDSHAAELVAFLNAELERCRAALPSMIEELDALAAKGNP